MAADLSQEALALKAGIGSATIRRLEKGLLETRTNTLQAVAAALQVDLDELIGKAS